MFGALCGGEVLARFDMVQHIELARALECAAGGFYLGHERLAVGYLTRFERGAERTYLPLGARKAVEECFHIRVLCGFCMGHRYV